MSLNDFINKKKIGRVEETTYTIALDNAKKKEKFIKRVERVVRSSMEYRDYIVFLKEHMDMSKCAFFNNVDSSDNKKIKIEIHHEPFTLYNIVRIVLNKWISECIPINDLLIADEVMDLHYKNMVGLIPLSKTVHQIYHNSSKIIIPLYLVYGNYKLFLEQYGDYIDDELDSDIYTMLENKINETNTIKESSFDVLERKFEYLEVDGFSLPQRLETEQQKEEVIC